MKKTGSRLFAVILSLCMVLTLFPQAVLKNTKTFCQEKRGVFL